ncbi:MAG: type I-C CRISPR-associated protein Cas8c/Csd1 [Acidobacteria bacterium]|nr:type I-C CRISPR-associated protein Cas8c/Csd1 [Acidobacteriota bacterium]
MLLKALYDFAHSRHLLDDLAFAPKAIRWVIQLDVAGNLLGVVDTSEDGKRGKEFSAPFTSRPKVAGGIAEFLADGITALFGLDMEPENDKDNERKRKDRDANNTAKLADFKRQLSQAYADTQHPALAALTNFYGDHSMPAFLRYGLSQQAGANEKSSWWLTTAKGEEVKLKPDNFTFQVEHQLLLEDETLRDWWRGQHRQEIGTRDTEAQRGICLITGADDVPIAATHTPKIKGVPNTQEFGAAIVSFDKPAFASYGFDQSRNAPASTEAATAYSVALNHMLATNKHSLQVGGMKVCFWARNSEDVTDVLAWAFEQPKPESVRDFLRAPRTGTEVALAEPEEFYSVTLSGNVGRIVVRHWMQMPLDSAIANLRQWFADLQIEVFSPFLFSDKIPPLALFRLACTTVRDAKDLQADIPAQLYRCALDGTAPPLSLLRPILNRLTADLCKFGPGILETPIASKTFKEITDSKTPIPPPGQSRMALIRLILNRNNQDRKDSDPMIEPQVFETKDEAYNCGRLLALFDDLQMRAHDYQLEGAGVVERYYGAASSAPNSAFGILWRLHQHHLKKVSRQGDKGRAAAEAIKRKIAEIAALFPQPAPLQPPQFPRTFSLQQQGRFALGFYQQKAADDAARRTHQAKQGDAQPNKTPETTP